MTRILKRGLTAFVFALLALFIALGVSIMPKRAAAEEGAFTLQKTTFAEGEAIYVSATGGGTDWIGIFREGENSSVLWYYVAEKPTLFNVLNGTPNAGESAASITAGTYTVAFIPNNLEGLENATSTQTITVTPSSLRIEKTRFAEGEQILVSAIGSGTDWVGVYREGETLSARWYYVSTAGSGNYVDVATFGNNNEGNGISPTLSAGNYTIYLIRNDGEYTNAEVAIPITITPASSLYVEKTEFTLKEPIYVTATHTDNGAWVGLYRTTESEYCRWYYVSTANNIPYDITKGEKNIETSFSPNVMRGEYVLRLMVPNGNGGYDALSSVAISVVGDTAIPSAPLAASYVLENDTDGYATGTVTVTMSTDELKDRCIALFWGDDKGIFEEYSYIKFKVTGQNTAFTFGKNVIIPFGATKLYVYAKNTNGDALSQNYVTVDLPQGAAKKNPLGASEGETFWVISDTHIDQDANHVHNQHLTNLFGDIARIDGDAMSLIINGDLTNRGREGDFANFQAICESATGVPPIVLSIGNHEYYNGSYEYVANKFFQLAKYPDGSLVNKMNFDYWQGGYHFIFLGTDTTPQGFTHAVLNEETLTWFDRVLDEGKDEGKPTFVFLHQPMYNTIAGSRPGEDYSGVEANTEARLRQILADHPEVMFFNGHTHWTMNAEANMYEGTEELPIRIFNTSSAGYLWTTYDNASGDYLYGSEGYYLRVVGDTLYVMGYDFIADKWISAAQYCVDLNPTNGEACEEEQEICKDEDGNHVCDTCGEKLSDCKDENSDHACDTCGEKLSDCLDENGDHACDTCAEKLSDCKDENADNYCDICGERTGEEEPDKPTTPEQPETPDNPNPEQPDNDGENDTENTPDANPETPDSEGESDVETKPESNPTQGEEREESGCKNSLGGLGVIALAALSLAIRKRKIK